MGFIDALESRVGTIGEMWRAGGLKATALRVGGGAAAGAILGGTSDYFGGTEGGLWGGMMLGATLGATSPTVLDHLSGQFGERLGLSAKAMSGIATYGPMAHAMLGRMATGYGAGAALDATGWTNSASGWGITAGAMWGALRFNSMLGEAAAEGKHVIRNVDLNGAWARVKGAFNSKATPKTHSPK